MYREYRYIHRYISRCKVSRRLLIYVCRYFLYMSFLNTDTFYIKSRYIIIHVENILGMHLCMFISVIILLYIPIYVCRAAWICIWKRVCIWYEFVSINIYIPMARARIYCISIQIYTYSFVSILIQLKLELYLHLELSSLSSAERPTWLH